MLHSCHSFGPGHMTVVFYAFLKCETVKHCLLLCMILMNGLFSWVIQTVTNGVQFIMMWING